MNYNRPSGGYQKNLYRQKMNEEGIKAPKTVDNSKLRLYAIIIGVCWIILSAVLIYFFKWLGLLFSVIIGAVTVGGIYFFLQNKQKEIIKYYKQIGLTEEQYVAELRRRKVDPKQIEGFRKVWRKVKI